ncbi:MAG TPA: hypothetical protein DIW47_09435 [Bacteroidetes bacterium]|nr:hypothetical protein [Bacteroidota bacterium]
MAQLMYFQIPMTRFSASLSFLFICLLPFITGNSRLKAQSDSASLQDTFAYEDIFSLNFEEDVTVQLLPLDTIVDIAFRHSPTLRFHEGEVGAARAQVILAKRSWHPYISTFASSSYGSQNIALNTYNPATGSNQTQATNGYTIGATIVLPLSVFTQTPVKIDMMRQELKKFEARVDEAKLRLRREIISEYFKLVTAQRLLKIISEDVQTATLTLNIAEVQFQNGTLPPSEFSRIKNLQTIARTNYELQFREFATAYFQFEALVGVEMFEIKRANHP